MKYILSAMAGLGLLVAGSAANAADAPRGAVYKGAPVYQAVSATNWAGPYIGAYAGYIDTGFSDEFGDSLDHDGFVGGGLIGYNFVGNNFLYGIEADFGGTSTSAGASSFDPSISVDMNWLATIRARIGVPRGNWLFFATAGIAFAEQTFNSPPLAATTSDTHTGFVVGGGVEYAMTHALRLRGEYLFHDFGDGTYNVGIGGPYSADIDDTHVVRGALIWSFGN